MTTGTVKSGVAAHHNLDFDYPDFLDFNELPGGPDGVIPMRGWYFLCTIKSNESLIRPMYRVEDRKGKTLLVAFYLDNGNPDAQVVSQYRPGTLLCIKEPMFHYFLDGQAGLRLEDEQVQGVTNLKCSLEELDKLNDFLYKNDKKCKSCGAGSSANRCGRCAVPYCKKECQNEDWAASHKKECRILKYLRELNQVFF